MAYDRVSSPQEIIFPALADITACFCFPRIHADLTGTFGFMAKQLFFLAMSCLWLKCFCQKLGAF
jgi:hypothetical protein